MSIVDNFSPNIGDRRYAPKIHNHEISEINELQNTLDNHTHEISDINELNTELNNIKNADVKSHNHEISDINNLETTLNSMSSPIVKLAEYTVTSKTYNISMSIANQTEYKMLKIILLGIDAENNSNTGDLNITFNNKTQYYYYSGYYYYNGSSGTTESTGSGSSISFTKSAYGNFYLDFSLYSDKYYSGYCIGKAGYSFLSGNSSIAYSQITTITLNMPRYYNVGTKCIIYGYK